MTLTGWCVVKPEIIIFIIASQKRANAFTSCQTEVLIVRLFSSVRIKKGTVDHNIHLSITVTFSGIAKCCFNLGDNCIKNFHLGRYIVGFTVRNFVLLQSISRALKRNFLPENWWYMEFLTVKLIPPQMKSFITVIPILMHFALRQL